MALPFATRRLGAWLQFLLCALLLVLLIWFRATNVDAVLGFVTIALLAVVSVLVVRARWKHRHPLQGSKAQHSPDPGDVILQGIRRWWTDEKNSN